MGAVYVTVRVLTEFPRALFHQDDDAGGPHVPVGELFPFLFPDQVVLAHEKVCSVAEAAFNREIVADALHFHGDQASVGKLYQDVHDEEGGGKMDDA